jgi:putative hydrolase of the HAD superfamily
VKRALVFDLDDTLYPERRFALSGFHAVSKHVAASYGVPHGSAFAALRRELRAGRRADAFQSLIREHGLPKQIVDELRYVYRAHVPALRLPSATLTVLTATRGSWKLAILTNGAPEVQRRKVAALGLAPLVDAVVYAHEVGGGKPDPAVFQAACASVNVPAQSSVMTGDNPWCDVDGARRAGLRSIRIRRGLHEHVLAGETGPADATVRTIGEVPSLAVRLIPVEAAHAL